MSVTFTGLSSGIDTGSLVSQLVSAERAPAQALALKQSDLNTQKSIVGSMSTALAALGTAARSMDIESEVQPRVATSSDARVTVASSSGAAATVHDLRVRQLARGEITSSRTFSSADAGQIGDGTLSITTGTTTKSISYASTDSLADIANKINSAGAGASASVLFDGTSYRLMVASTGTGTAAAAKFVDGGDSLGLSDPANIKVPARDAIVSIDGVDVTRGTNVIGDAVAGLTFTLVSAHAETDAATSVGVTLDTNGLRDKLKSLVAAYNAVNSALHVQLDYNGARKATNTLFGDAALRQLQGALGAVMSSGYGTGGTNTLGAIGLTRAKDGALTLDETKLSAALATNPDAVGKLFVTDGFAAAVTKMADSYTRPGDGILAAKSKSMTERASVLQKQAEHINSHADRLKTRLEAQFTALEVAMSKLKSQSAFLSSIFG
jgi:flagellar hook-associated protein 2